MQSSESIIRRMTRLALEHQAVNLSQGYTDEAPPYEMVWGAIAAVLGGTDQGIERLEHITLRQISHESKWSQEDFDTLPLKQVLAYLQNSQDQLNQYSFPYGLLELRQAIADYTERWYGWRPDPESEITVSLGATEGLASVLGAVCDPGDQIIVFQPFHEMYPSQAQLFGLRPVYVTLTEHLDDGCWRFDPLELRAATEGPVRALLVNTPQNPTGKVFTRSELQVIAELAVERNLLVLADEIYEHIVFDGRAHHSLATFDGMRDRTVIVNSISKTGRATGWRVGWIISPAGLTPQIRGLHDTLVIQAPTPLQKAAIRLLDQPQTVYDQIRVTYEEKRRVLADVLQRVGFRFTPPEGAYYLFANYRGVPGLSSRAPMEAALFLTQQVGVACVPGDNFYGTGTNGEQYLRFAFCRSLDTIREAGRRLLTLEKKQ